ncbi:MAG: carboxypeptidase regulatory-like domain-containing protein [Myxococcota bacterium]
MSLLFALPAFAAAPADEGLRPAAQKGLHFLAKSALAWQTEHQGCFGCHVQAVSIEGLAVGEHHQYTVPKDALGALVDNLISGPTGVRSAGGLSPGTFPKTSRAFAGAGLARYDKYLGGKLTDDLLRICRELLPIQRADGAVVGDHPVMGPVAAGTMQTTYQAMQAWRQCYARSADDAWRGPLRRAESFVLGQVTAWKLGEQHQTKVALQDLNHALMALVAAGVGGHEPSTAALVQELLSRQGKDGGWAFGKTRHPMTDNFMSYPGDELSSNPLATGQTVYALRAAGLSDRETPIANGLRWLITNQQKDGGWGASGAARAEAMWAVLGLVSVDVVTLSIRGVSDGEKVSPGARVIVEAKDNTGLAVNDVSLFLDDKLVLDVKGPELSFPLPPLATGKHFLDAVATNARGQTSRRRVELFSGDVFLTQLGARFDEEKQVTEVSLRNIATEAEKGSVELEVFKLGEKDSEAKPEARVSQSKTPSMPGPVSLSWAGKSADGQLLPRGRYLAKVSFRDAGGNVRQSETQVFFHDSERVQREKTGEIQGNLGLKSGGAGFAADSTVELVDDDGKVVATTRSNESGNFRFKAVPRGTYRVRAKKEGYQDLESAPVAAEPKAPAAATSLSW